MEPLSGDAATATAGCTTGPPADPPLRASDADRLAAVSAPCRTPWRELLTAEEGGERMAAAFAATELRALGPLTVDLPPAERRMQHPAARRWRRWPPSRCAPGWPTYGPDRLDARRIALVVAAVLPVRGRRRHAQYTFDGWD